MKGRGEIYISALPLFRLLHPLLAKKSKTESGWNSNKKSNDIPCDFRKDISSFSTKKLCIIWEGKEKNSFHADTSCESIFLNLWQLNISFCSKFRATELSNKCIFMSSDSWNFNKMTLKFKRITNTYSVPFTYLSCSEEIVWRFKRIK